MITRSERQRQELKMRHAEHVQKQQDDLLKQISALRKSDLPAEFKGESLSSEIERWQIENGYRKPHEGEGLSPIQKGELFRLGLKHLNAPKYSDKAFQDASGAWLEEGMFPGTTIPARPILPDIEDFAAQERADRRYRKAASNIWSEYRVLYDDPPELVQEAMAAAQQQFGTDELLHIANGDEFVRVAAMQRLHNLAEQIKAARAQGSNDDDGGDGRTDGFGAGSAYSGALHAPAEPEKPAKFTEMGRDTIAWQKKMGVRKW